MQRFIKYFIAILFLLSLSKANAQIRISGQFGIQLPTGDFGIVEGNGFGLTGTIEFYNFERVHFTGSIGYHYWGKSHLNNSVNAISYTAIPVLVGFRYYFRPSYIQPYIGLEAGICYVTRTQTDENTIPAVSTSDNNAAFGFDPSIGILLEVEPSWYIDINVKYNTTTPSIQDGYVFPGSYVGINGGLEYLF